MLRRAKALLGISCANPDVYNAIRKAIKTQWIARSDTSEKRKCVAIDKKK
jgi:hypothetical protein